MQLLRAASAGDQRACGALFARYEVMARALGRRHFNRECDVDDLLQDAVVDALRNLHTLRNGQAFCRWFGEVVIRTMGKRTRRRRLERRHMRPLVGQEFVEREHGPSTEALVDLAMLRERMPELTEIMALQTSHGHSLPELAKRFGVSLSTTKRRIAGLRAASIF
ncbi:MAG TPA: sigma-70 family RNA polymerase sigma factor [Polyangiales bacterium]|nr:sigma-70 family RNA polymerase sigma factor [Polyangiales bacterium]